MAAVRALAAAAAAAGMWPFCGAIACGERGREAFVFLAGLSHRAAGHEILQLLVSTQAQHFLAAAGRISRAQIFVHDIEELLELERCTAGKHRNQFLGHQIGNSTGECVFLENSHKAQMISRFARYAADFSAPSL